MTRLTLAASLAASLAFAGAAHAQYNGVSPQGGFGHAEDSNSKAPPYPANKDIQKSPMAHQLNGHAQPNGVMSHGTTSGTGSQTSPAKSE
jgi:hypothetical protein